MGLVHGFVDRVVYHTDVDLRPFAGGMLDVDLFLMQLVDAFVCNLDSSAVVHIIVVKLAGKNEVVLVCTPHSVLVNCLFQIPVAEDIGAFSAGVHSYVYSLV